MKSYLALKILSLITLLFAANAHAVIIEGNFKGTVRFYSDDYDTSLWSGYWDKDIAGTTAWGTFWYDTDKAPGNVSTRETSSQFRSNTNEWVNFSFTIGGKTFSVSDLNDPQKNSYMLELVSLQKFIPAIDASSLDRFHLSKNMSYYSGLMQRSISGSIEILDYDEELISGLGLLQEFDWFYKGDAASSRGRVNFSMLDYVGSDGISTIGWIELSEAHVKVKNPQPIPEPSSLFLLCLGLAFYWLREEVNKRKFPHSPPLR